MLWIFVDGADVVEGRLIIEGPKAHHLARVLRVRPGERGVAVHDRIEHQFEITRVEHHRVVARVLGANPNRSEPRSQVTLLQALLPRTDFEAVLEAGTALGITGFIPVRAARSVVRTGTDHHRRWHAVVESAAEQSRRGQIPQVLPALPLADAIAATPKTRLLVLEPGASTSVGQAVIHQGPQALAVGPEGGWTAEELEQMRAAGGQAVSLGPRVLRARLAGIVAAAILMEHVERSAAQEP